MIQVRKIEDAHTMQRYLQLRHQVFCVEKDVPQDIQLDEFDVLDGICDHFLLCRDAEPVGAFRCRREGSKIQLQRFCVLKEHRGQGFGRIMLEHARDRYTALGFEKIAMEAKYSAMPFYQRCGCVTVSDIFMEVGLPHVNMELILDKSGISGL